MSYFGMPVEEHDKSWVPHFSCARWKKNLEGSFAYLYSGILKCQSFDIFLIKYNTL